uniref:Uncharacterized protein n=1 Tax=Arcella intermedia TaxID=1963864 RepID=A0A6B2LG85_9EUKA
MSGEELFLCVRIIDKTGNKFVSGAHDSQIVLWDMNTKVEKYLLGHTGPVWAIDVSPNKLWIVSAGDLTIKLWSLESLECKLTFTGHKKPISCVKFLDDHSIVSGSQDHTLRIWDIRTGACTVLYGHTKEVLCMAFHRDLVITGSADGTVRFWQPKTQECHLILNAHTQSISSLEVYEDTLVTSSRDGSVKLFKIT